MASGKSSGPLDPLFNVTKTLNIAPWVVIGFIFLVLMFTAINFAPGFFFQALKFVPFIAALVGPVIIPVILFWTWNHYWLHFKRDGFIQSQGSLLLEIKLPREIYKSPKAMELALMQMHQPAGVTWKEGYLKGKVRPWYSFEMVSLGGEIHFYIWTWPRFKDLIESQLYAQYPGIQIVEAKDYTEGYSYDPDRWNTWSTHFTLDKDDAFPIKTYIDYGLDKNDKEEYKIDPMAAVIEFLGTLKPGEQIWIQILAQGHRATKMTEGTFRSEPDWTEAAEAKIKEIKEKATQKVKIGDREVPGFPNLTKGQQETIAAIERSIDKLAYEVMIRGVYLATPEAFNPTHIPGLISSFKQYSSKTLNAFRIFGFTDFDYPWEDPFGIRLAKRKKQNLEAYKRRAFFNGKYKHLYLEEPFILTVEELATVFHFPGVEVSTPTLPRIPSVAGEAPPNLPI